MTDSDPKKAVSAVVKAVTPTPRASATVKLRSNFAANHLLSARDATVRAHAIQRENSGTSFGPWFNGMLREVPVAFIMSAAALEAQINEVLQDILDGTSNFIRSKEHKILLKDLKKSTSGNPLEKCIELALLLDNQPDTKALEWADARLLIKIRNRLMHFKPAWSDGNRDSDLEDDLQKRSRELPQINTINANILEGRLMFPHHLVTYEWAKWSIKTVLNFEIHFTRHLGVTSRFPSESYELP
jgi:hypothetical protein